MPSPLFHPEIMDHDMVVSSQHNGVSLPRETDQESRDEDHQDALRFALDQLSFMALEKVDCGGGGLVDTLDGNQGPCSGNSNGGYVDLQMLEHQGGSRDSPTSCSPSPEYYGSGGYHMTGPHSHPMLGEQSSVLCNRKRSVNMTECVPVPSSEHVAEIVGRQGCKIKALRAKTNTYIKTPVRGEEPVFIVTGRREDVEMAKREIVSAAEHFSMIRASRCKAGATGTGAPGTGGVRVPYRVVGLVVGPKGATIKRIQQQTHTYIVTPSREKDPVFEVTGMPENVDRAREEIETHITLRTGAFVDLQGDNDFHTNGTDVSLEGLGSLAGGGGAITPRLSPTLPSDAVVGPLDHPLARRAQSDPLSTLSWLQSGGAGAGSFSGASSSSSGGSSTGYSSCSASSLPGGSPTDSEGGGSGLGSGMLGRLKAAAGAGSGGLVCMGPGGVSRDCFVCFESEVTAALVPCGHNLFCMDCAGQICQSAEPECPVCHTTATQCIRIFS
uniref:Mex-3 RNA binding family member D n=1 Tax=Oncorhynchus kisutch TaxID=8019 RepID=A0A8C7MZ36_ONCKI